MATIPEALSIAIQHQQAGRLAAAEQGYRQILAVDPNQPEAIHFLGVLAWQVGKPDIAVELIQRAIQLKGTEAGFHCNLANVFLTLKKFDEAIACCHRATGLQPNLPEAHCYLGNALLELGRIDEAIACCRRALALRPDFADAYVHLGNALQKQGELDEAIACYLRALKLRPDFSDVHVNLGNALFAQRHFDEAISSYRRALELKPQFAEAQSALSRAVYEQGNLEEASVWCHKALELKPNDALTHFNLGNVRLAQTEVDGAIACYRRAIELDPSYEAAHNNLGIALQRRGQPNEAIACYRRAIELNPNDSAAHNNLGDALRSDGQFDEAVACCRRALELQPDNFNAHNSLGNVLKDQGQSAEAVNCYRRALDLKPDFVVAHSNLLYALYFCPEFDAKAILEEHRRWDQQHAQPLAKCIQPHLNERSIDRPLRVGYVSPDFCHHPVGLFLLPLLEQHDHTRFQISCYSSVPNPDPLTERCHAQADVWRNVRRSSDEQLAGIIRDDQIDILVDLTMHMANSRPLLFAHKPAPVQVAYLAYAGTTGLSSMNYRLTDPYLDPPSDSNEPLYSEDSIWLPETYWCYRPSIATPPVNELPAHQYGEITFGCLNNFGKVSGPNILAWIELLQALPNSRLLLHAHRGSHRERVKNLLAEHSVSPARLTFLDRASIVEYFQLYQQIDVALDTFPYAGGTTTCDALWMGVPVVSLAGQTAVGRGGLSILTNVGLPELVARDAKQYVQIAVDLACDLPRLGKLRATLRERMQHSPLMDAPRFTRHLEAAYREMWRRWCVTA